MISRLLVAFIFTCLAGAGLARASVLEAEFMANWQQPISSAFPYLIEKMNRAHAERERATALHYELTYADVPEGFRIQPRFETIGRLTLKIEIDKSLADNPIVALEILTQIRAFSMFDGTRLEIARPDQFDPRSTQDALTKLGVPNSQDSDILNPLEWAEVKVNAEAGEAISKHEVSKFEIKAQSTIGRSNFEQFLLVSGHLEADRIRQFVRDLATFHQLRLNESLSSVDLWSEYSKARQQKLAIVVERLAGDAKSELRAKLKKASAQEQAKRFFESRQEKLDAMVLKNDREGVARLLEAFLPWPEMSPIEKGMWRNWIEAIRRPNLRKSVLAYRGIESDEKYLKTADGKTIALISTMLSRNQGSYTRRLRSLKPMRLRFGAPNAWGRSRAISPLTIVPKLTSMMSNHSADPIGSPFLSFTPDVNVAANFATGGDIIVVKLDERRLLSNIASRVKAEVEMFVPLIIFPDEILYRQPIDGHRPEAISTVQKFVETYQSQNRIDLADKVFSGYRRFAEAVTAGLQPPVCRAAFLP